MRNAWKVFWVAWAAFLGPCVAGLAVEVHGPDRSATRIAQDRSLPGKGVRGQCLPFAKALHDKLQATGFRSEIIIMHYDPVWPSAFDRPGIRRHAIVAFDDHGQTYVTDNETSTPVPVHDTTPFGMATEFGGRDIHLKAARVARASTISQTSGLTPRKMRILPWLVVSFGSLG